jgi:CTP:molybdopterin cytidylyltransferase MocA
MPKVAGLVLAAGAGRRLAGTGGIAPKALVRDENGTPWVVRVCAALAGCDPVLVVTGAGGEQVARLVEHPVACPDWAQGLGASLRAGLDAADRTDAVAVLIALVDMPFLDPAVVARLLEHAAPDVLARAAYQGVPGHPVLLGREHWPAARAQAQGDQGARELVRAATLVECGPGGEDFDDAVPAGHTVTLLHRATPPTPGPGAAAGS